MPKSEIQGVRNFYRQEWRRVEKKPATQQGLTRLDEMRRNHWQKLQVGLLSDCVRKVAG